MQQAFMRDGTSLCILLLHVSYTTLPLRHSMLSLLFSSTTPPHQTSLLYHYDTTAFFVH